MFAVLHDYVKNDLFIFTPCLPHHSHPGHWDQIKESLCPYGQDQHRRKGFRLLWPLPLGQSLTICPCSHLKCNPQEVHLCDASHSPRDTSTSDGPLMLWSCVIDFAIEHWFGCLTTEPGYAGDIGTISFDWLSDWSRGCRQTLVLLFLKEVFGLFPYKAGLCIVILLEQVSHYFVLYLGVMCTNGNV